MAVVNKFNVNKQQVTLDADIIENMSANDVSYDASTQYNKNTVGDKLSKLEKEVIYDVSSHNNGMTFASLSALLSSENLSTLIPISVRHGGMTIRFVQSSDNKYVQYFLTKDEWSVTESDWERINLEDGLEALEHIIVNTFYVHKKIKKQLTKSGFIRDDGTFVEHQIYKVDYYSVPSQYATLQFNSQFLLISGSLCVIHYFNGNTYISGEYVATTSESNYSGILSLPIGTTEIAINRSTSGETNLFDFYLFDENIPQKIGELEEKTSVSDTIENILKETVQINTSSSEDNKFLTNNGSLASYNGYYVKYYTISGISNETFSFKSYITGDSISAVHYYNGETYLGREYPITSATDIYSGVLNVPSGTTTIAINTKDGCELSYQALYDGSLPNKVLENSERITALEYTQRKIKALFIGNSLNQDHVAYVPWLLKELYPEVKFEIYISYIGGITIKKYVTDVINGTHKVDIFSRAINTDKWTNVNNYEYADIFSNFGPFDIISFQGYSISDEEDVTYFPVFVQDLYSRQNGNPFRLGYNLTQNNREQKYWVSNMDCLKAALLNTPVNIVFPCGVVTELVRSIFGTSFITSDNLHNQQGLPCIMGAYTIVLQLIRYFGLSERILNNSMRITSSIETYLNIPGPNGTLQIGTDTQYLQAQEAAIQSVKYIDAYCDSINIGII